MIEACQPTEETVDDGSRVQEIGRRGNPGGGRVWGRRFSFRSRPTPGVEIRPGGWNQRFRSIGQDEVQVENASPVGVTPERQRLAFERVLGAEDGDV